jgi:tetratricopeptide (TPR) repeat protein
VKLDAVALLTQGLPRDPPAECEAPMEALRGEARKQVMAGDDLRLGKDAAGAIQKYRAALSMDACNGYAWLGLGESAVAIDRPDIAIRALRNATTLLPQHYGAWTELGQSYEAIRQLDLAVAAYKKAVALKAGLEIPLAGLQRLGQ